MSRRDNGLRRFAFHRDEDEASAEVAASLAPPAPTLGVRGVTGGVDPGTMEPERAARLFLQRALGSERLPSFAAPEMEGEESEFKALGHRKLPLTNSQTVKFRQFYRKIPIYGSLVTVEMDARNRLLSINSSMGEPSGVDAVATLSAADALARVRAAAGYPDEGAEGDSPLAASPRLFYYFDAQGAWRLVYITENVFDRNDEGGDDDHHLPQLFDYVLDAHSGGLVVKLPRTQSADFEEDALDGLAVPRRLRFLDAAPDGRRLADASLNVHTYDFGFHSIAAERGLLPGDYVVQREPDPWDPAAVSAHANASEVADFLTRVLLRNGLDDEGGKIVSSINCVRRPGIQEWRNAAWIGTQMVYGQRVVDGVLRSYAVARDVVAHEIFHGVTEHSARLEYFGESGALNESYSDIFGILISNLGEPDVGRWSWQIGEELDGTGLPLRDLSDPTRCNQPAHMDDYREMEMTAAGDWGGVHTNSGIHNKAAYNLLTARDGGAYLLDPETVAKLFYLTLTEQLSRTSGFSDSRRGSELVARSLLRSDERREEKLAAIGKAFADAGIE
jgi:bacillolysin/neutral peptidase B